MQSMVENYNIYISSIGKISLPEHCNDNGLRLIRFKGHRDGLGSNLENNYRNS